MTPEAPTDTNQRCPRLARRFRNQQAFAVDSSPLVACLCGVIADWLDTPEHEHLLVDWLLAASEGCSSLSVPMLLMAALHREILGDNPRTRRLAEYFPTVGGTKAVKAEEIGPIVREVILEHRERLAAFLRSATVQTNETARGICWLLPVLYPAWPAIHLVDLGCSAGLNLVADQRCYRLSGTKASNQDLVIGHGLLEQFPLFGSGAFIRPPQSSIPHILSRTGCDLHPFFLETIQDELTLSAFIWGDQIQRLTMLRQGITALHQVKKTDAPVRLFRADLPKDLPAFLTHQVTISCKAPIVVYTTYLTPYLPCKGVALREYLHSWAQRHPQPVLWLQWEPIRPGGATAPVLGWLGWTADLWFNGHHHQWHLAWVHPHGTSLQWLPGLAAFADFWRHQRS